MHLNTTGLHMFAYDGHGHSTGSDGLHEPEKIIDMAIAKGLQIVGLSDHNVVSKLPRFLDYADKINSRGTKILPIPGIEISTNKGHLLVTLPIREKAEEFISNFKKFTKKPHPAELIEEYVQQYNAIVIFVHPDLVLHGFKLDYIETLVSKIPERYHKNLGIEIYNWMAQALFWSRREEEKRIHSRNHLMKLSPFSFTDYHSAYHVGNGSTAVYMKSLSEQSFVEAVHHSRTAPLNTSNRGISEYLQIVKATLAAEALSRTTRKTFHIPKS